jgi:hypothetical protein
MHVEDIESDYLQEINKRDENLAECRFKSLSNEWSLQKLSI